MNMHLSGRQKILGFAAILLLLLIEAAFLCDYFNSESEPKSELERSILQGITSGTFALGEKFYSSHDIACLASRFPRGGKNIDAAGSCSISGDAIIVSETRGKCLVIDVSELGLRVLTGSHGEWECKALTEDLTLEVIERYGQSHLIFSNRKR